MKEFVIKHLSKEILDFNQRAIILAKKPMESSLEGAGQKKFEGKLLRHYVKFHQIQHSCC